MARVDRGTLLGERYELTDRIAAGGMGEVWEARDRVLGRAVAVKVIAPSLADDQGFVDRFRKEARLAARLNHPNIAQVYDFGETSDTAYLVMELVPGSSVAEQLAQGYLTRQRIGEIIEQAGAGLEAAHDEEMVHRDVKPANMLLTSKGTVKLTDFGIARALGEAKVTNPGEVMGTVQYLSPEAAVGHEVDRQSDVYSLAVVAYELLAGRRPFQADSAVSLALKHVKEPPPPLPASVPPPVAAAVLRGLAKDPRQRPYGTVAFARGLTDAIRASEPAAGAPTGAQSAAGASPWASPAPERQAPGTPPPRAQPGGPQPWNQQPFGNFSAPVHVRPQGPVARGIAWSWIAAATLTALSCFLPFASANGQSWNAFALSTPASLGGGPYEGADDALGWLICVPMLIVAAMGLPAALRRPHLVWPLVAIPGCLWSALIYVAAAGTAVDDEAGPNPAHLTVGSWAIPLLGTLTLALVITSAIKRR